MSQTVKTPTQKKIFPVLQMSCAACALSVESILKAQVGVIQAEVNYAAQTARVEFDPQQIVPDQLKQAVQEMGYDLLTESESEASLKAEQIREASFKELRLHTLLALSFSLPVFIFGMFLMHWEPGWYLSWVLSTPVVWYFGRRFFVNAWKQTLHKSANMDSLVALSTGTAYLFSVVSLLLPHLFPTNDGHPPLYFEASAVVISFILLGRLLEERAKRQTSSAIRKLMGLQVKEVTRIQEDGQLETLPVSIIIPGDILLARPGDQIAVDGIVVNGESFVDESAMNGEPIPLSKTKGSPVLAGTLNGQGSFQYRAEKTGKDTLLARIIGMVQEAQGSKPPIQTLADKIAGVFVPSVLAIALLTLLLWGFLGEVEGWSHGLLSFLTVLVVACPCALGLATPTALMAGMGKAASKGILIKDASSLELAGKIGTIAIDKTGTLTLGKPVLTNQKLHPEANLGVLVALESSTTHPLAEAVVTAFPEVQTITLTQLENIPGKGVKASYNQSTWMVGTEELLLNNYINILPEWRTAANDWKAEGKSLIWFADHQQVLGLFACRDELRSESVNAVKQLQNQGIEIIILSGDQTEAVREVAKACGIEKYQGKLLPNEKAEYIKKLQASGKIVAMVGDGINDSTALATADVSIAMGKGSDIALETAQMTLLNGDLHKIAEAIQLSHFTLRIIRQNLFWAFAYNVLAIPLAAGILYPFTGYQPGPMLAGAAMALSSLSVVGNSLRLVK